jgi:tetratricopeptide (TPR) repeat protein
MVEVNNTLLEKARIFFERARKVAWTNNFDYAIDMYLEGLRCAPDALEEGHIPLRELALLRQGKGGKKPTMVEKVKRMRGKTPLERMINAAYLLAKDPDHIPYAEALLKASVEGDYRKTAKWIADLLFQANNASSKPSLQTYQLLMNSYSAIELYDRAVVACQFAFELKGDDEELENQLRTLEAELAVSKGKYDQAGDFRKAIVNRESQEKLHSQEGMIKSADYRLSAVEEAKKAFAQDPNLPKNIFNLAQALAETEDEKSENEAIRLLENAYANKKDFSFKQRAGQIKIALLIRRVRRARALIEADPSDIQAKEQYNRLVLELKNAELEHYRLNVENYPTDVHAKYEYGIRLFRNEQFDDAIPLFQESQKDPRHKIASMSKIGSCFYMKGWYTDAIDIFKQAIDVYEIQDDSIAKELRYNLARSYEANGDSEKALELYRRIAQLDFGYKDVRQRVDVLRKKDTKPTSQ